MMLVMLQARTGILRGLEIVNRVLVLTFYPPGKSILIQSFEALPVRFRRSILCLGPVSPSSSGSICGAFFNISIPSRGCNFSE